MPSLGSVVDRSRFLPCGACPRFVNLRFTQENSGLERSQALQNSQELNLGTSYLCVCLFRKQVGPTHVTRTCGRIHSCSPNLHRVPLLHGHCSRRWGSSRARSGEARGLAAVRERRVKVAISVTKANKQDEGAERDTQGNLPR